MIEHFQPFFREHFLLTNMNAADFCVKAGISKPLFYFYMNGDRIPAPNTVPALAKALGVPASTLRRLSRRSMGRPIVPIGNPNNNGEHVMSKTHKQSTSTSLRAKIVLTEINASLHTIEGEYLKVGRLLSEIKDNDYFYIFGYTTFHNWVNASGLGLTIAKADALVRIANGVSALKLTDDAVSECSVSQLAKIFTLDPETNASKIKQLIKQAPTSTVQEITNSVRTVFGKHQPVFFTCPLQTQEDVAQVRDFLRNLKEQWGCNVGDALVRVIKSVINNPELLYRPVAVNRRKKLAA